MNKRKSMILNCSKCEHKPTPLPNYHCNKYRLKQSLDCRDFKKVKRKRR